jgi:hypothetical protein
MFENHPNNQIDLNDLAFVNQTQGLVIESLPCPMNPLTNKINPNVSRFRVLGAPAGQVTSVFHVKPIYYEHRDGGWRPLYEVTKHHGNRRITIAYEQLDQIHPDFLKWLIARQKLLKNGVLEITSPYDREKVLEVTDEPVVGERKAVFSFTTSTFYPDPSPETATVDGIAQRLDTDTTWAACRGAASATGIDDTSSVLYHTSELRASAKYEMGRLFMLFDTSAITDSDTIDSGTLITTSSGDDTNIANVGLVQGTTASNTAIATGDYDGITLNSPTEGATAITPSGTDGSTNTFTLNASGLSWVNKSGVSNYCCRYSRDISDSAPSARSYYTVHCAEYTGTTRDPKLTINHTANPGVTINPSAQVGTFSIPAYTPKHGSTLSPNAQVDTFSIPAYTVRLPKVVSVSAQVATFSIPSYSVVIAGVSVSPSAQTVTFSIPTYQVQTYALIMPNGQTLTFTLPAYTLAVESNVTISPNTLVLTFTLPNRTKVGAIWVKRGRSTNATWVRSTRNSN